jgi:ADP-ribosylation factor GTPase-activating protein 2/3
MAEFNNSGSISSSDYFNDGRGREDEFDITAGELMSKMSVQARQDVQHIKAAASRGAKVIGEFLNELK